MLTPCKGASEALTPLARLNIIQAMPYACYGTNKPLAASDTKCPQ